VRTTRKPSARVVLVQGMRKEREKEPLAVGESDMLEDLVQCNKGSNLCGEGIVVSPRRRQPKKEEGVIEIELGLKLFKVVQEDGWAGRLLEFGSVPVGSTADQVQTLRVTSPGRVVDNVPASKTREPGAYCLAAIKASVT
jgi:hypothetical protein